MENNNKNTNEMLDSTVVENKKKKKNRGESDPLELGKPKREKRPLTKQEKQKVVIAAVAAAVALAIIVSCTFLVIIPMIKKDPGFDYIKSDLSKYVKLSESDYRNYSMNLTIAKPREIDVDIALLSMQASDKDPKPLNEGTLVTNSKIGAGDIANIYYRGYIVVDGVQKTVVSNLSYNSYTSFEIGAGKFPTEAYPARGVENALVDLEIVPDDYNRFIKIKSGEVKADHVIYVTFTRKNTETNKSESGTTERIDLLSDRVPVVYGDTFKEALVGTSIGDEISFKTKVEGVEYEYTDVKVNYVTECEREPIVVTGYYPYNTGSETLNNKEITFEIYVQSTQDYNAPEINDEYIEKKVLEVNSGLRLDELMEYDGDNLVEKYRNYAWEYLNEQYDTELRAMIAKNMWNYYNEEAEIKRIPGGKVEDIYLEYYSEVNNSFIENNGVIFNEMAGENGEGETETYDNLSDYAKVYLKLWYSEEDWTVTIRALAEDLVIERMIMYYVMKDAGLTPTDSELADKVKELRDEYMEEYIFQYLVDFEETREEFESSKSEEDREYAKKMDRIIKAWKNGNYDDAEFKAFYEDREEEMFKYYDDDYFTETAYYEIVTDHVVSWAQYTTLDTAADK